LIVVLLFFLFLVQVDESEPSDGQSSSKFENCVNP